ncbi:MAG: sigma-70 family RNA polymerase sigma factor, partial [Actinobacteria bacterium]|nr:sigma-70 family RNA polymerase sigma factor [Actinomycetota bacterium]
QLSDPASAGGYLRTSVINGARSSHRRAGVVRRHLRVAEPDDSPAADSAVLLAEEHRQVIGAVQRLSPRQREVLVLRYWAHMSEAEIAATLHISPGTVKSTASRALTALADHLGVPK